jgi:hypothetical protein
MENSLEYARSLDQEDTLKHFGKSFIFPNTTIRMQFISPAIL